MLVARQFVQVVCQYGCKRFQSARLEIAAVVKSHEKCTVDSRRHVGIKVLPLDDRRQRPNSFLDEVAFDWHVGLPAPCLRSCGERGRTHQNEN